MEHIKNYETSSEDEIVSPPFSPIDKNDLHEKNVYEFHGNDETIGKEIKANFDCMKEEATMTKSASNEDETLSSNAEEDKMEIGNNFQKKHEHEENNFENCREELCRGRFCARDKKTMKRYVSKERNRRCYKNRSPSRNHESRYEKYRSQNPKSRSSKTHFKKTSTYTRKRYRSPSTSSSSDSDKDFYRYTRTRQQKVQNKLLKLGIKRPEYFNPTVTNSSVFAEQLQKRRNLWKIKNDENKGESIQDDGNPVQNSSLQVFDHSTSKMRRLLGIKTELMNPVLNEDVEKSLETEKELMSNMEQQYNVARNFTHSYRGAGLGFVSFKKPSP